MAFPTQFVATLTIYIKKCIFYSVTNSIKVYDCIFVFFLITKQPYRQQQVKKLLRNVT
jgi:hypothetical protein